MLKALLAVGAAAAALAVAAPAQARHHRTGAMTCARWHHHHCLAWRSRYNVGYLFGPNYSYVTYRTLPGTVVTRYHLGPRFRYVNQNGYVYVVNPNTYRVVRVITVP
jgi:hypothetical protein